VTKNLFMDSSVGEEKAYSARLTKTHTMNESKPDSSKGLQVLFGQAAEQTSLIGVYGCLMQHMCAAGAQTADMHTRVNPDKRHFGLYIFLTIWTFFSVEHKNVLSLVLSVAP
jgi:hypothetical protein